MPSIIKYIDYNDKNREIINLMNLTDADVYRIKEGKNIFLVKTIDRKYVIKYPPLPKTVRGYIRYLLRRGKPIRNEIYIYKYLNNNKSIYFKHPKLIDTDYKTYLVLSYTPLENRNFESHEDKLKFIRALVEFQTIPVAENGKLLFADNRLFIKDLLLNAIMILPKYLGIRNAMKYLITLLRLHFRQNTIGNTLLIHGDFKNNIAMDENGSVYLYDFEGVKMVKKWYLGDIITRAFNDELKIDKDMIISYVNELSSKLKRNVTSDLQNQLRIALLLRITKMLTFQKKTAKVKMQLAEFMVNNLLPDNNFKYWYTANIEY